VVDPATNSVIATVQGLRSPAAGVVHPDGSRFYVTNTGTVEAPANTVSIVDTTTNGVVAEVQVGSRPTGIALVRRG
jgi:YVTN family beta-propeller protein